jgi:voltage-gated potassium channel
VSDFLLRSLALPYWRTVLDARGARRRVFDILEGRATGAEARAVSLSLTGLISLNILAVILETVPGVGEPLEPVLAAFEAFSVTVFTLEYALRLWSCTSVQKYQGLGGRLRYAMTPLAVIDLAVILPAYLPWEFFLDLRFARVLRLVRILRLFKVARYSKAVRVFVQVLTAKRADLGLIGLLLGIIVVLASSTMYFAEHHAQPEVFRSIPAAMWWSVQTLTTVGYGDMYPVTPVGRLLGTVIALVGIGFFALPAGILATGFAEEIEKERRKKRCCPHCKKELPLKDEDAG